MAFDKNLHISLHPPKLGQTFPQLTSEQKDQIVKQNAEMREELGVQSPPDSSSTSTSKDENPHA